MIPHQHIDSDEDWKAQLRDAVTSPAELLFLLDLEEADIGIRSASRDFPLLVPRGFIDRMQRGDPNDPLLRQVLPRGAELQTAPGYSDDPVGETAMAISQPGIIQKYQGRVLLILASGCAVNCRYCFRRHFPYADNLNSRTEWLQALETIAADDSISEVILSGGDPLLVSDRQLEEMVARIAAMPHIKRLRIHTRLPVVIPQRVTPGLVQALTHPGLKTVMVIHSNHARELNAEVAEAMRLAGSSGLTLLNQSVLLAGVNDSCQALTALSERLFEIGVLPYYLHLLDKVRGAAHFEVPAQRGAALIRDINSRLPGYLVPRLVREEAGAPAKTPVPDHDRWAH